MFLKKLTILGVAIAMFVTSCDREEVKSDTKAAVAYLPCAGPHAIPCGIAVTGAILIAWGYTKFLNGAKISSGATYLTSESGTLLNSSTTLKKAVEGKCPNVCTPAAGTKRTERIDIVPPAEPHHPCAANHAHIVQMNQSPKTCACFWNKATPDVVCLSGTTSSIPSK